MIRRSRFIWLLLLFVSGLLRAGDEPQTIVLSAQEIPAPYTRWYGVYGPNGMKFGYARIDLSGKQGDAYQARMEMCMKIAAKGQQMEMEMKEERSFSATPPFGFLSGQATMRQNTAQTAIAVRKTDAAYTASIKQGDQERQLEIPKIEETLSDFLGLEVWLHRQPHTVGQKLKAPSFSLQDLESTINTATVTAIGESIVGGVTVRYYELSGQSSKHGDMGVARCDDGGTLLSIKIGGMFELRLESEELAKKTDYTSDLFVFGVTRLDKPLGDPRKVLRMTIEVTGKNVDKIPSSPEQTVRLDQQNGSCLLKTGRGNGQPAKAAEEDIPDNLKETPVYPINDPEVKKLAQQACGDAKEPREKINRLVKFVNEYLKKAYVLGNLSVKEIIAAKRGDCSHHARLLAALARASGVPAREVGGLMYMGDNTQSFGAHAWNEVVLDGNWVPVDAAWGETEVDGAHIRLAQDQKLNFAWLLGQVKLKLIEVEQAK